MKRITTQEFENLSFKVQMLSEKVDRLSASYSDRRAQEHLPVRMASVPADKSGMIQSKEAAEYLGIPLSRLYYLTKYNQISFHRIRRKMVFDRQSLDAWKSSNQSNER